MWYLLLVVAALIWAWLRRWHDVALAEAERREQDLELSPWGVWERAFESQGPLGRFVTGSLQS